MCVCKRERERESASERGFSGSQRKSNVEAAQQFGFRQLSSTCMTYLFLEKYVCIKK